MKRLHKLSIFPKVKLSGSSRLHAIAAGVIALIVVFVGYVVLSTHASGTFYMLYPANGVLSGNATAVTDGSGGEAVQFGSNPIHSSAWWTPPLGNVPWQWEIGHALDINNASDMGIGVKTYTGAPAPNPTVYDIDGFDNPASTVSALHGMGFHAICYIEVGAAENYRPDYTQFPASALGNVMPGYSNERYVNIKDPQVVSIIKNRVSMCASKGFDAIEPDIDDSYTAKTGFSISQADNVAYNTTLSDYAHSLGLGYGLKNGDDPSYAAQMVAHVDFALDEQCFEYSTCGAFYPAFGTAGKAVFEVEYNVSPGSFCAQANTDNFNAVKQNVNLSGGRQPCR